MTANTLYTDDFESVMSRLRTSISSLKINGRLIDDDTIDEIESRVRREFSHLNHPAKTTFTQPAVDDELDGGE